MSPKDNLDDNIAKVLVELAKVLIEFMRVFRWPLSIAMVAGITYLGWIDVPVFEAIVDAVVKVLNQLPGVPQ